MDSLLVLGTWALVVVTFRMARAQISLLRQQTDDAHTNICLQNHLNFTARFDSAAMLRERSDLAAAYLSSRVPEIQERVLDFFEDLGLFVRRGYLDEERAWDTFGFYAVRWWATCKGYILQEREAQNDQTLFSNFEDFTKRLRARDANANLTEPSPSNLDCFLKDERELVK
jgi:hypothetical protein